MPLLLLHEIFPKNDGGMFLVVILLYLVGYVLVRLAALLGIAVIARAGRMGIGPGWLRRALTQGPRPSLRVWLAVLAACVLAGAALRVDNELLMLLGMLVLSPGSSWAIVPGDSFAALVAVEVVIATVAWVCVVTGVRAAWAARRPVPAHAGHARTTG